MCSHCCKHNNSGDPPEHIPTINPAFPQRRNAENMLRYVLVVLRSLALGVNWFIYCGIGLLYFP